jgi:predicted transcriptional regulator
MSTAFDQLAAFQQFAHQKVDAGEAETLEELFDLWRLEHPTPEEQTEIHEAIRQGFADIEAGRYRPADEVMNELRAKYNLPRE